MYIYEIFFTYSLLIVSRPFARASNDAIYTENGGPINDNLLEEEIIEQLAKQNLARNWAAYSNKGAQISPNSNNEFEIDLDQNYGTSNFDVSNEGESNVAQNSDSKIRPKLKKQQGQQEFSTFVDPIPQPSLRRTEAKPSIMVPQEVAKRAEVSGQSSSNDMGDTVFIVVVTACTIVGFCGVALTGLCFYRLHKQYKLAQESEYPHYGVTGPAKERTSGQTSPVNSMDAKLASSAQLYHYQHTKQQIIAMEHSACETKGNESEDSEGEGEEGDFSVYECPGLAPTGDLEVSNPLFENASSSVAKTDPHRDPDVHRKATE